MQVRLHTPLGGQAPDAGAYPVMAWRGVASLMYPGGWPGWKRWPQVEREARDTLAWLATLGYVTWMREPGGRRISVGVCALSVPRTRGIAGGLSVPHLPFVTVVHE